MECLQYLGICQLREFYSIGLSSKSTDSNSRVPSPSSFESPWLINWRERLTITYEQWKKSFESSIDLDPTFQKDPFTIACISLYRLAHICLHINTVSLQCFAGGVKQLLNREVTKTDQQKAYNLLKDLCLGPRGPYVAFHASQLLKETLAEPAIINRFINHKFITFLAVDFVWTFAYITSGPPRESIPQEDIIGNWKSAERWINGIGSSPKSMAAYVGLRETRSLLITFRELFRRVEGLNSDLTEECRRVLKSMWYR